MPKPINKIIKTLISSDVVLNAGWGLLGPVFAIFIVEKITIGDVQGAAGVAGFASLIYWLVKSFLQIPIGIYLDKNHGDKDDFWFMVLGTFLVGFVPFGYLIASLPWHIYICQAVQAIGMAMVIPSWSAIFTRHIDKGQEAFGWGIRSTSLGFGLGIAGAVGGLMVAILGFKVVFVLVGTFTFVSVFLLLFIQKDLAPRDKTYSRLPSVRPPF